MDKLKSALDSWRAITDENAHYDTIGALAEATIATSPIMDKLSTWAAAGCAAVAGLVIANIDKVVSIYNYSELRVILSCLVISLFLAIAQKYFATMCSLKLAVGSEVKERLATVLDNFDRNSEKIESIAEKNNLKIQLEFDLMKTVDAYLNLTPGYMRIFTKRGTDKAKKDKAYTYKKMLTMYFWQSTCLFLQLISLATFVLMATLYL